MGSIPANPKATSTYGSFFLAALWFGIAAGLVEGAGLLIFQRLNWARWGPMLHVSEGILWIAPLVDLCFFLLLTGVTYLLSKAFPRIPWLRLAIFLLAFLSVYDWLTLTNRLYHWACLLLSLGVATAFDRRFANRSEEVMSFWRSTAPRLCAILLIALIGIPGAKWLHERNAIAALPSPAPGSPNVLIVVVDTLRADRVSSYGQVRSTTPNIDRLADEGALFENAFATCSWSLPSHVSILTGHYEFEHGVGNVQPMTPWVSGDSNSLGGLRTLGEALQARGYRTGAFSANRTYFSRDLGFGRGFSHFEDYFHSPADMFVRTLWGREFARLYLNRSERSKVKRVLRFMGANSLLDKDSEGSAAYGGAQGVRKRASTVNQEALRWIDRDQKRPFFVFLNYFDVHYPYGGPAGETDPVKIGDEYDAGVSYVDAHIGRLLAELKRRGVADNTLVIVTSDHGESLGQHGLTYHAQALYLELIRVPLVIRYPGRVPAGTRITTPVSTVAIAATVMDLLGENPVKSFSGPPLRELWEAKTAPTNWPIPLSELTQNDIMSKEDKLAGKLVPTGVSGSMKSLVTPQWHFIVHDQLGQQIYDWKKDNGEADNLINTPEGQAVAFDLSKQLDHATQLQAQQRP